MSCSYNITLANDEGGLENNVHYDIEFLDGVFTHLAIVNNPRYERANIVLNSKAVDNYNEDQKRDEKGQWAKDEDTIQKKKDNLPTIEDYKNPQFDFIIPNLPQNVLKNLGKKQKPLILKKNIIEKNKNNHPEININDYNDILTKGIYQTDVIFKTKSDDEYFNFVHYGIEKNPQVLIELSETKDNYEIVNFYKLNDKNLQRKLNKAIKKVDNEGGQVLIDSEISEVGDLSNLEINSIFIITDSLKECNPNIVEKEEEREMALLDELKKLVASVENAKEDFYTTYQKDKCIKK